MAPYQQKELIRFVAHKVVISREAMELGLYARMPEVRRAVPPNTFALSDIKLVVGSPGWCLGAQF